MMVLGIYYGGRESSNGGSDVGGLLGAQRRYLLKLSSRQRERFELMMALTLLAGHMTRRWMRILHRRRI
ncbi:hypothetical protein I7I48_11143 [Histoplasma ohiense]|nr:hypothetical protein I7I48_11143 [Histoplasma ohiense (nom. inval.)]